MMAIGRDYMQQRSLVHGQVMKELEKIKLEGKLTGNLRSMKDFSHVYVTMPKKAVVGPDQEAGMSISAIRRNDTCIEGFE